MSEAIVMINTDVGKENEIFDKLNNMPEVKKIYLVYGIHDIIVFIEAENMERLRSLITDKIRKLDGVKSTLTSIVVVSKEK
ncbi:MAG: Lrp/AsnC ligand binding domain-containing protein [Caldisphaeraceae archaeon]|nr:Lrp/AsnC ligand binding domain-containing protein [Caldisphaeraceae archaeon]MEB3692153.1 Lrp/AsnC ligand binding domain-containing protein [Caldisphaeraceae archaeon]MEB3797936.1 Lrp/AsnC ligand binding domain-containing protein [Caldisphaeraceae archaeon]